MGSLSREEVEAASFRDSNLWEFGVTDGGRAVYLMFDGASWDGEFVERTIQLKIQVRGKVDISRRRGTILLAVPDGYADNLATVSSFSVADNQLDLAGILYAGEEDLHIYRGEITKIDAWMMDDASTEGC